MSIIHRYKYECQHCGNDLEAELCDFINADKDPVMKKRVMEGTINCVDCPACGETMFVEQHPFVYHDMTKKLLIYYIPEDESQDEAIEPPQSVADLEGYVLRYVTALPDLVEKVFVFEDGLNDIVVEQLKNEIWFEMQTRPNPPVTLYYETTNRGRPGGEGPTVYFLFEYESATHPEGFSYRSYMRAYERCRDRNILAPDNTKCICVNCDYVYSRLSN